MDGVLVVVVVVVDPSDASTVHSAHPIPACQIITFDYYLDLKRCTGQILSRLSNYPMNKLKI